MKRMLIKNGKLQDLSQSDINEIFKGYIECALWTELERLEDDATMDIDDEDMDEAGKTNTIEG